MLTGRDKTTTTKKKTIQPPTTKVNQWLVDGKPAIGRWIPKKNVQRKLCGAEVLMVGRNLATIVDGWAGRKKAYPRFS